MGVATLIYGAFFFFFLEAGQLNFKKSGYVISTSCDSDNFE